MPKVPPDIARANRARAARENSKKSTGAKTTQGKLAVSRNSVKHGLRCEKPPLLLHEDGDRYREIVADLHQQYEPVGALEQHLVDQIAMCIFKQNRAWSAEAAIHQEALLPTDNELEPAPETNPDDALDKDQRDEVLHLRQLRKELLYEGKALSQKRHRAQVKSKSPDEWTDEREEAEAEDCLNTWPECWEESLYWLANANIVHMELGRKHYPVMVLKDELGMDEFFWLKSEDEQATQAHRFNAAMDALTDAGHPYALLKPAIRDALNLAHHWEADDNPYKQIERVPTDNLDSTAAEDAQRILDEWDQQRKWSVGWAAEHFYKSFTALIAAIDQTLADMLVYLLLADIGRKCPLLQQQEIEVQITRCKI